MKRTHTILTALALLIIAAACTSNNGRIGHLFGTWQLQSIEATDPADIPQYDGKIYWAFQSSTVQLSHAIGHHDFVNTFGCFRLDDNTLILDLVDNPEGYPMLGLPQTTEFAVLRLSSKQMVLMRTLSDGHQLTYRLRRW